MPRATRALWMGRSPPHLPPTASAPCFSASNWPFESLRVRVFIDTPLSVNESVSRVLIGFQRLQMTPDDLGGGVQNCIVVSASVVCIGKGHVSQGRQMFEQKFFSLVDICLAQRRDHLAVRAVVVIDRTVRDAHVVSLMKRASDINMPLASMIR